jgi:hypothetical protein
MPILSIITQPAINSVNAAYRPIIYRINAVATNGADQAPVVYCDIYFGGVYYKTISLTQYDSPGIWVFDIQDAAQEYLQKFLAPNGGTELFQALRSMTRAFCRFRSSGYDSNGFIIPEGTTPVQATGSKPAQPGTGFQSSTSYIVNCVLQHEDNQDLPTHLNTLKQGVWALSAYPLTHRPKKYSIGTTDSDFFPIAYVGANPLKCIRLNYRNIGQNGFQQLTKCFPIPCPVLTTQVVSILVNPDATQKITLGWQPLPVYVTSVLIEYRAAGSNDPWLPNNGSPESPRQIVLPLGKYDFRFTTDGDCTGQTSGELYNVGEVRNPCKPVSVITLVRLSATSWRISWAPVAGSLGYVVEYRKDPDTDWTRVPWQQTEYTFQNLQQGSTYYARVRNVCEYGEESDPSNTVSFEVPASYTLTLDSYYGSISSQTNSYKVGAAEFPITNDIGYLMGMGGGPTSQPPTRWHFEKSHTDRDSTTISIHVLSSSGRQLVGNYELWVDGLMVSRENINTPNNSWFNVPVNLYSGQIFEIKLNY